MSQSSYATHNYFRSRNFRFANFVQIRESLRRENFYIGRFAQVYAGKNFFFCYPNLLTLITHALDNALNLAAWPKKGRHRGS